MSASRRGGGRGGRSGRAIRARAALCLSLACAIAACAPKPPARRPRMPDVVVIVLDAVRADRFGCLGNDRGLTPFLDSWAERSVVFHRAYSAASYTVASIASLLTSRLPSQHGVEWFGSVLSPDELTFPEVLDGRGFQSAAFTGNLLFPGFDQGFRARKIMPGARTDAIATETMRWLRQNPDRGMTPRLLYLHLMEGHYPYEAAPVDLAWRRRRADPPDVTRANATSFFGNVSPPSPDALAELEDTYDGAVRLLDDRVRQLFTGLRSLRTLDDAVVIVMADHGEDLAEHDVVGHGRTLFETSSRVPLLLHLPGQTHRIDVREVVSLLDVAPTVLDLLGIPPSAPFAGRSLRGPIWRAAHPWLAQTVWHAVSRPWSDDADAYGEFILPPRKLAMPVHATAIVRGSAKLIITADGTRKYYDLDDDPGETRADALGERMRGRLERAATALRSTERPDAEARVEPLDEETREHLRALGYAEP